MWKSLCRVLNIEDVANDPRYKNRQQRAERRLEIGEIINRETRKFAGRKLEAKLLAADVPCGKVRNVGEIVQEPHVQERGILEENEHPESGKTVTVKTPILLSGETAPTRRQAPMIGEHTKEILKEWGYGDSEVQHLINRGVAV